MSVPFKSLTRMTEVKNIWPEWRIWVWKICVVLQLSLSRISKLWKKWQSWAWIHDQKSLSNKWIGHFKESVWENQTVDPIVATWDLPFLLRIQMLLTQRMSAWVDLHVFSPGGCVLCVLPRAEDKMCGMFYLSRKNRYPAIPLTIARHMCLQ